MLLSSILDNDFLSSLHDEGNFFFGVHYALYIY